MNEESVELQNLRRSLKDGEFRIADTAVPMRLSWFPDFLKPDLIEEIYGEREGDRAVVGLCGAREVESEFWEEVCAFKELLKDDPPDGGKLADWQQTDFPAARRMYQSLNRKAEALSLWDWYAVPLRYKNGRVYRIWSPADVMNAPIIRSFSVQEFLLMLCIRTSGDNLEIANLNKRVQFLQSMLALAAIVILACISIIIAR